MIDIIARGMIEESNGDISQISEKVNNHTEDSDIHVTTTDKENWNSHPNDVQASGNPVQIDGLQGGVPFSEMVVRGDDIIGHDLTVNVCGKNLIPFPYHDGYSKTHNGITFTVNSDGSVTANGTATDVSYFYIAQYAKIVKNGVTYAISGSPEGSNVDTFRIFINERKSDGTSNGVFIADFNDDKSFTVTDSCNSINIAIQIRSGVTVDNVIFRPQLEIGSTATPYEPYHGAEYTITPDSNPYAVPNDIRQQDGYNIVSVSEGELSVTGVRKNAAIKRIWDDMSMDLLFDGVTSADNPAVVNLAKYNMIRIDVGGNYEGTTYFNCGSTYLSKSTLDFAFESYGCVAIPASAQAIIINISKSGAEYSLSFSGFNEKQLVDVIKIYGIK